QEQQRKNEQEKVNEDDEEMVMQVTAYETWIECFVTFGFQEGNELINALHRQGAGALRARGVRSVDLSDVGAELVLLAWLARILCRQRREFLRFQENVW